MRLTVILSALTIGLCVALATGPAVGETLNLVCRVHETRAGGAHRDIRRRLDIDLSAKTVRFYDDLGQGWRFKREYPFLSADAARIRLESAEGKDSYVDRQTGHYYFHNQKDGLTIRGPCQKTSAQPSAF